MKRLKEIGKALKSVVLSMAHMDYQMEFKKRKKAKTKGDQENSFVISNYNDNSYDYVNSPVSSSNNLLVLRYGFNRMLESVAYC